MPKTRLLPALLASLAAACAPGEDAAELPDTIELADVGFMTPESVLHDTADDVYLVSNINGSPFGTDDNGFISRIAPDGELLALKWIDGANDAVELNAPKGMAIIGDSLFVTDIDMIRVFDRATGAQLGSVAIPGATFMNDLSAAPDGSLYATDSGLREGFEDSGTDAVYRFADGGARTAVASGPALGRPNGVLADDTGVTVVTFGSGTIYRFDAATGERRDLPMPDQGQLDGVVRMPDGALLVSSWAASAVYRLGTDDAFTVVVDSVPAPADIGYDARRGRVLIPLFTENRVIVRRVDGGRSGG